MFDSGKFKVSCYSCSAFRRCQRHRISNHMQQFEKHHMQSESLCSVKILFLLYPRQTEKRGEISFIEELTFTEKRRQKMKIREYFH